ncbi:MAG TPA: helix-turn-helix transcriptional regulator [Patescibacteria group bacterium]|nr:helix-turn-helix transcriptional regulator [Patescibacteria group bacterium]
MDYVQVGRRLKEARVRLGLKQEDVAARAGVSQPTVSDLERGVREGIAFRSLAAVAEAVGVSVVVGGDEEKGTHD